jgi:hypothetical protein
MSSRSKRLEKICKYKRVVAMPSKKVTGEDGISEIQLYNIYRF